MTRRILVLLAATAALLPAFEDGKQPAWAKGATVKDGSFAGKVYFGGQPAEADVAAYAAKGVKTIVNLRSAEEMAGVNFDEAAAAKAAGIRYVQVPVSGSAPAPGTLEKIYAELRKAGDSKVLLHCASSNRVGMVWATFRGQEHGVGTEDAIREGKAAGLKAPGLEKAAREVLSGKP